MSKPAVYIAGQRIADAWTLASDSKMIALADFAIPWGRSDIYEELQGHLATITLLDTSRGGEAWQQQSMLGFKVEIYNEHATGRDCLLSGSIAEMQAETLSTRDPFTGEPREVRKLTLTVADTVASLAKIKREGEYPGQQLVANGGVLTRKVPGPWGYRGWEAQYPEGWVPRLKLLSGRFVNNLTPRRSTWSTQPKSPEREATSALPRTVMDGVHNGSLVSIWELIRRVFTAVSGLGWPSVRPGVEIVQGEPRAAGSVWLAPGATATNIVNLASDAKQIPAKILELESPTAEPFAPERGRIARIKIELSAHEYNFQERLVDSQTGRTLREDQLLDADSSQSFLFDVGHSGESETEITLAAGIGSIVAIPKTGHPATHKGNHLPAWNAALALGEEAAARAAELNDQLSLPLLAYRPRSGSPLPELLRTWDSAPLLITGSKFAGDRTVPDVVQIIGGTVSWTHERGGSWESDLTMAAAMGRRREVPTISTLAADIPNPISRFNPAMTIYAAASADEVRKG